MVIPKRVDAIPHLLRQNKSQNAIKLAKQIISKDSKNYLAHYYLGKAYILENKSEPLQQSRAISENAKYILNFISL
jgi:predicted Zn-dependent protease